MVVRVRGVCSGSGRGGLGGLPGSCASTSTYGWPWWARLGWAVPGGLVGERRALGRSGGVL